MRDQPTFEELIQRLRHGDEAAATELIGQYEMEIRRFIRFRLTTSSVRRFIDSLDVSQSVFAKFFVEVERGSITVNDSLQLRNLLLTMARNKLYDHARKEQAVKRDARRLDGEINIEKAIDPQHEPSEVIADAELVAALRARLTADELYLVNQRMEGRSWDDLAKELQSNTDAVRKRMARAIDRAARKLGMIE